MHDSNMSDSQFIRFQINNKKRMNSYASNFEKDYREREFKARIFRSKTKKKTFLERVKSFLNKKISFRR